MKYSAIPNSLFRGNRSNLLNKLQPGSVALVFGAHQMPRNGDQFFPYRQQSDFFYLSGIEQESSILLLCKNSQRLQEILFIIKANKSLETWEGHKLTVEEAQEISGIKTIKYVEDFEMILHSLLCTHQNLYFNLAELPKFKPEVKSRDHYYLDQIKHEYPTHTYLRLAPILQELRLKKSEHEINLIRKACAITGDAFERVLAKTHPGMMEYEVEAEITYIFTRSGANDHAYAPIVAGGKNACALHYTENNKKLKNGDLLLMDFGAEYANYSADLSRTIPVNGIFNKRQKDCYESCLRVFKFARSLIKPGTTISKFHEEVCKMWEIEHIKLGLYSQDDLKNNKTDQPLWFKYYMHGTSHFMGLDVHDTGTRETVFQPGMVVTCEPGLYIEDEGIGIRIENDILITDNGHIDLMADIPIEIEEIESWMNP